MARYIDADKLTFSRVRIIHSDGTIGGWHAVVMSSVIKDAPTDDVVEVVRCKDCKYYKHFKGLGNWCHRRIRSDIEYHTKTTDFCSYGERKEQT